MITVNQAKLKQIVNSSDTATRTMLLLGLRERSRASTTLSSLKAELVEMGEKVDDRDFIAFWKGLEQSGVGSIILGRRGGKTRFQWNYSLRQVAKASIDEAQAPLKQIKPHPLALIKPHIDKANTVLKVATTPTVYQLPTTFPGLRIEIKLIGTSDQVAQFKKNVVIK